MTARWDQSVPTVGERRIAVRTTRDALRQIRGGSPWLYDGSIESLNDVAAEARPGELAVVFDDKRKFAAIGLWDPASPIRVKILHVGSPVTIDHDFWVDRLGAAFARRSTLAADESTDAYRCVHGENDHLPGLVIDRYADTAVVKLYTPAWFAHLRAVVAALRALPEASGLRRIVLRFGRSVAAGATFGLDDGDVIDGPPVDGPVRFVERGLAMQADVVRGQKTGHFLDQRDNRALVRGMANGADVLDVFASTGGFSLAAAAGGAKSVHLIDRSGDALATAERNIAHNRRLAEVRRCALQTTADDAFAVLSRLASGNHRYDLVIVDPPSFAPNAASVPRALAAYSRLARLAAGVVERGSMLVMSSCSSRVGVDEFAEAVRAGLMSAKCDTDEIRRTGHAVDHPIGFEHGAYLKALFLTVR